VGSCCCCCSLLLFIVVTIIVAIAAAIDDDVDAAIANDIDVVSNSAAIAVVSVFVTTSICWCVD
jgi:hypothetical protein